MKTQTDSDRARFVFSDLRKILSKTPGPSRLNKLVLIGEAMMSENH